MIPEKNGDLIQWLRGFYFTAKNGGIRPAARDMGRSQSSVSHHIKCLEEDIGVKLFDRSRKKLELTDEGLRMLDIAIQIFETISTMDMVSQPVGTSLAGQVSVVTTHAVLLNYLPKYVAAFRTEYPHVHFTLESGSLNWITGKLLNGEAGFGIACPISVPDNLDFEPLFDTRPVLISPLKPIWDIPSNPTLEQIAPLPFISFPSGASILSSITGKFASKGLTLKTVLTLTHFEHVKNYVEMGLGVSIMDAYTISNYDHQRIRVQHISDFQETRIYGILTRKNSYLNQATRTFVNTLNNCHDLHGNQKPSTIKSLA